jgi:hypothetical protein
VDPAGSAAGVAGGVVPGQIWCPVQVRCPGRTLSLHCLDASLGQSEPGELEPEADTEPGGVLRPEDAFDPRG